jgi:hypothetical protein
MGLSYNPETRKWNKTYEKTDYKTDYIIDRPENLPTDLPEFSYVPVERTRQVQKFRQVPKQETYWDTEYVPGYGGNPGSYKSVQKTRTVYVNEPYWENETYTEYQQSQNKENIISNQRNRQANEDNKLANEFYKRLKASNEERNNTNIAKNAAYDKVITTASSTQGGDYVTQRNIIRNLPGINDTVKSALENNFKAFYQTEKLVPWNVSLGAKPPYGTFDVEYYKNQNPQLVQQWNEAVANDDLDIVGQYGEAMINNDPNITKEDVNSGYAFYLQHYTNVGKAAGQRANRVQPLKASEQYVEKAPTDVEKSQIKDLQLNVDFDTATERLLRIPEVAAAWEKAKEGDPYWKAKGKEFFLDANKPDEFVALFRLSDRQEDKDVVFNYNINAGLPTGITDLEDAINQVIGEKGEIEVKKFGALTQDALKQTIDEMKKAKAKEQNIALLSGLGPFKEIIDINKTLANSILGDSGVGGILSFISADKKEEDLEKSLQGVTGVNNNNTVYNWQKWFDDTLKKRYEQDIELGLSAEEADEKIRIEGDFARQFIQDYLIPRFDESRSMDEFVEYMDVRQEEQNPFQTQALRDALKLLANTRAEDLLKELSNADDRRFDFNFYFNPTGDKAREERYTEQAKTVAEDWKAAKKGDEYWASQAYRFGVNVNDKEEFARMHYQVKGKGRNYDGAEDIYNASKIREKIFNDILPSLEIRAESIGTVFGEFIKPEEFADAVLEGVDPSDKEEWNELLKQYGLDNFKGSVEEVKEYIKEALRTGSAQKIRESIKYLNKKGERPTQEKLGVTYIEREEDYEKNIKGETALFKVFQEAGYKGTEDEFYENYFPDVDRSEQIALTKAGTGESFKFMNLDLDDPYTALGSVENLFGSNEEEEEGGGGEEEYDDRNSYFRIDMDDDLPGKSKAGQSFLGEFTSMFKGFS